MASKRNVNKPKPKTNNRTTFVRELDEPTAKVSTDSETPKEEPDPPWSIVSNWPTQTKAASRLGISQRRFLALMTDGSLRKYRGQDKTIRFNPDELDALRTEIDLSAQVDELDVEERKAAIALIREQSEALKDARDHIKQLISMITEPMKVVQQTSENLVKSAIDRANHLEELRDGMIKTREAALDRAAERDAFLLSEKASEERKTEAFNLAKANAPRLIAGIEATLLGGKNSKLKKLTRFIESLDPGMVSFLLDADILSEEQRKDLKDILPERLVKAASEAKEEKKEEPKC